jgi:prolyl-tRNA synthetase
VEIASAEAQPVDGLPAPQAEPTAADTPGARTVEEVCGQLGVPQGAIVKAFPVLAEERGPLLVVIRGDHRLNEIKLQNALGAPFRPAEESEVRELFGSEPGFIGPVGAPVPVLADEALRGLAGLAAGGNRTDVHLTGVEPGRDFDPEWVDVRRVEAGDRDPSGAAIRIEPAIEVGNIFKLGTRYSEPLGARYLDEDGKEQPVWMGSYGIGPARTVAAAIEQFADEQGISWPRAVAPFDVELVTLGKPGEEARSLSDQLYDELRELGLDVLYDDRDDASPGQKFADAELLGCPLRVTVGRKSLEAREIEFQVRRGQEKGSLSLEGAAAAAAELWRTLP